MGCKNQACRSYGENHPNCACSEATPMAKGGMVGHCASNNPHGKDCEYYSEKGNRKLMIRKILREKK